LVVVGCGGFIGSHLLDRLLGIPEIHIDGWDPSTSKISHHVDDPRLQLRCSTMKDPGALEDLARAIRSADAVINLAAICNPSEYNTNPIEVMRTNFLDCYRLVELCAEHGKWLLHFSTSEVYGRTIASYLADDYSDPGLYELEEDWTPLVMGPIRNQRWTYACAKQLLERWVYAHHREFGMPFTIVRPLNFFGPRMDYLPGRDGEGVPRVLACFMTALLDGKPMQLVDGGTARRTIVSIHDAIRAILAMLEKPDAARNQVFNIGNRRNEVTMAELADLMRRIYARVTGDPVHQHHPIVSVPGEVFYGEGYEDCDRRMPKLDKARKLLGWAPEIPLEEALFETIQYYHARYGQ
jgi:UDP-apiose/xylose synthase